MISLLGTHIPLSQRDNEEELEEKDPDVIPANKGEKELRFDSIYTLIFDKFIRNQTINYVCGLCGELELARTGKGM
jgi:hypothetical protein